MKKEKQNIVNEEGDDSMNELNSKEIQNELNELKLAVIHDTIKEYVSTVEKDIELFNNKDMVNVITTMAINLQKLTLEQNNPSLNASPIHVTLVTCFVYFKRDISKLENLKIFQNLYEKLTQELLTGIQEEFKEDTNGAQ